MGKILDAFFKDELLVSTAPETRSPEHQKLCEKCSKLIDEMKEKLEGKEEEELFNALMETVFEEGYHAEKFFFQRGYRLGVLLTMEVFEDYNSFIVKQD